VAFFIFPEWQLIFQSDKKGIPLVPRLWSFSFVTMKRMTVDQADAARRRAATMLENFGDADGAAEFDGMTPEEYADHKGIEVTNPSLLWKAATRIGNRGKMPVIMTVEDGEGRYAYKFDAVDRLGIAYPWLTVWADSEDEARRAARNEAAGAGVRKFRFDAMRSNPSPIKRSKKEMAKSKRVEELEDTISDIYDVVQEAGSTRAEQLDALNKLADLCTDAIPSLDEDEEEGEGTDEAEDNEEE
jgi:hypothetical protein